MDELYILKKKRKLRRAFIFWDHANIFHNIQERKLRIDYAKAKMVLSQGYHLVAPIMYLGKPSIVFPKKQKFFAMLVKQGWSVIEKPLRIHSSGKKSQEGVDEAMYLDVCDFAKEGAYEKAIIASGDNVFAGVVKELKHLDMDVDVWSFRISISQALIQEVGNEHVKYFDDVLEDILLKDKRSGEQ